MKYLYSLFVLSPLLFVLSCSGSSNEDVTPDTAIETCYDVQVINAGVSQSKNFCTTQENGGFNGLGAVRFIKLNVVSLTTVSIRVTRTSGLIRSDPDIFIYSNGRRIYSASNTNPNSEFLSSVLGAGNYVIEISEFKYSFDDGVAKFNSLGAQKSNSEIQLRSADNTVSDCAGGDDSDVSGRVTFERVIQFRTALDYADTRELPIQEMLVQVICNGGVYSETSSDNNGEYVLNFPNNQSSFLRVRAQMRNAALWDFIVVDNTKLSKPVYVMDSRNITTGSDQILNLNAATGWGETSYTSARVAAPFAILDSIRKAKDKVLLSVANVSFPPLKINWSVENSTDTITSSFYNGSEIFLLGKENNDTDEYDEHVIIHEWAHYFEDKFSRSDSIGGSHGEGDILDIRVAFGEGFGNAFSAIATNDSIYIDTLGFQQSKGFFLNIENNNCINPGWYSECSVQSILYDIYDSRNEDLDSLSLDFSFFYNVLIGAQKNTEAMTSILSFIKSFKDQNPSSANAVDLILSRQNIDPVSDVYGSSQISLNPGETDQLPIYQNF